MGEKKDGSGERGMIVDGVPENVFLSGDGCKAGVSRVAG